MKVTKAKKILEELDADLVEMKRSKANGLCCGAGGAQMFKDAEKGDKEVNVERTEDLIETNAKIVATACPFCMTMISDGINSKGKIESIEVKDVAEILLDSIEEKSEKK